MKSKENKLNRPKKNKSAGPHGKAMVLEKQTVLRLIGAAKPGQPGLSAIAKRIAQIRKALSSKNPNPILHRNMKWYNWHDWGNKPPFRDFANYIAWQDKT
jgi:hypothetical protein